MIRDPSKEAIKSLLELHDSRISQAFIESVSDTANRATISRVIDALKRGNIDDALDALYLDAVSFEMVAEATRQAYLDGGRATAGGLSTIRAGGSVSILFNSRNLIAEAWLRESSSTLIAEIAKDQREGIRSVLVSGLESGTNPRRTALDIVGRVQRGSNIRAGGLIGLTSGQMQYVENARAELSSGDPKLMKRYLSVRTKRDRRFDGTINKSIREGTKLTSDQVNTIVGRYADRLLKLRGDNIARTESLQSLQAARFEAYRQAIQNGTIPRSAVRVKWKSAIIRTRDSHLNLHNKTVPFGEAFQSIHGSYMKHPGDTDLGARAKDIVNCRCNTEILVDYAMVAKWRRSRLQ